MPPQVRDQFLESSNRRVRDFLDHLVDLGRLEHGVEARAVVVSREEVGAIFFLGKKPRTSTRPVFRPSSSNA